MRTMNEMKLRRSVRRTLSELTHYEDPFHGDVTAREFAEDAREEEAKYNDEFGIALDLMDWHGGQWSALYSLASTWNAGYLATGGQIEDAITELERSLARAEKGGNEKDSEDLIILIDELQRILSGNV